MLSPQSFETAPLLDKMQTGLYAIIITLVLAFIAFALLKHHLPRLFSYGDPITIAFSVIGALFAVACITMVSLYGAFILFAILITGAVYAFAVNY